MFPLNIIVGFYSIFPDTTHFFTYMNGGFVFVVDCQQHFFHAVLLCEFQSKAKDLFAISFSLLRNSDSITNASNIQHHLFGKFGSKLKFSYEFTVVNCPIVKTDGLAFYQSLFFPVIPYIFAVGAPTSDILPAKPGRSFSALISFNIDSSLRDWMNLP